MSLFDYLLLAIALGVTGSFAAVIHSRFLNRLSERLDRLDNKLSAVEESNRSAAEQSAAVQASLATIREAQEEAKAFAEEAAQRAIDTREAFTRQIAEQSALLFQERALPHPVFSLFPLRELRHEEEFFTDFLGVRTRRVFLQKIMENEELLNSINMIPVFASFLEKRKGADSLLESAYPPVNEEYFEWIDVLESVALSNKPYTMIELGAGYGRWIARAGAALRSLGRGDYQLVAVEAEPQHFQWIAAHLQDNDMDPARCQLHHAAVTANEGAVKFFVGKPSGWYGQRTLNSQEEAAAGEAAAYCGDDVAEVKSLTLTSLLDQFQRVDLIDVDIQGAEFEVLNSGKDALCRCVKRAHIGTHDREIEERLRQMFRSLGWVNTADYPVGGKVWTKFGVVQFGDGIQTWINPRL